jgi:hypothetical protein
MVRSIVLGREQRLFQKRHRVLSDTAVSAKVGALTYMPIRQ